MNKTTFKCFAVPANYDLPGSMREAIQTMDGRPMEHVFVGTSDNHDWGCFGRGVKNNDDPANTKLLKQGEGNSAWAQLINGEDAEHPTGITNYIDGTCHSVANRLLLLADIDASDASGNAIVNFMYGKYGFGIAAYRDLVERSADQLNRSQPDSVPADELSKVLKQIEGYIEDELATVKKDFEQQFPLDIDNLPPLQRSGLRQIYTDFHNQRNEAHSRLDRTNPKNGQSEYFKSMRPALSKTFFDLQDLFGKEQYAVIFKTSPEQALRFLLG